MFKIIEYYNILNKANYDNLIQRISLFLIKSLRYKSAKWHCGRHTPIFNK